MDIFYFILKEKVVLVVVVFEVLLCRDMLLNRCFYLWFLGINLIKDENLLRIDSVCSSDVD